MDTPIYEPSAGVDKRLVTLLTSGPLAGLHIIDGTVSQLRAAQGERLPEYIEGVATADGRKIAVGLVAFKRRFVLYKEINGPTMRRLDKTFHPEQE